MRSGSNDMHQRTMGLARPPLSFMLESGFSSIKYILESNSLADKGLLSEKSVYVL